MTDRVESRIDVPAEHMQNIFGSYDNYIRKIENDCKVTIINRDGTVKITGAAAAVARAGNIVRQLAELSKRGNVIQEQNVNYAIMMEMENKEDAVDCQNAHSVPPLSARVPEDHRHSTIIQYSRLKKK